MRREQVGAPIVDKAGCGLRRDGQAGGVGALPHGEDPGIADAFEAGTDKTGIGYERIAAEGKLFEVVKAIIVRVGFGSADQRIGGLGRVEFGVAPRVV